MVEKDEQIVEENELNDNNVTKYKTAADIANRKPFRSKR
jgi:hypothetical protein